ncbi:hypothetical protein KFE25_008283 [Diacronema lutheri]|uniref:Uncharacterized protein n=1 Tax=Diacronema lutheri TaxID=2081491 RepID=A0A8J5XNH4_DIALT|nr:hypothetical protein KFE25_008283 [Diacronema lutheri]
MELACAPVAGARQVAVFDLASSRQVCLVDVEGEVVCADVFQFVAADGAHTRALASTADGRLLRWDPTAELLPLAPDGRRRPEEMVVGSARGAVLTTRFVGASLAGGEHATLLLGKADGQVVALDLASRAPLPSFELTWRGEVSLGGVSALELLPDAHAAAPPAVEPRLLVGYESGVIELVSLGSTVALSRALDRIRTAGPVRALRAQLARAALGADARVVFWAACTAADGALCHSLGEAVVSGGGAAAGGGGGRADGDGDDTMGGGGAATEAADAAVARLHTLHSADELHLPHARILDVCPCATNTAPAARALALALCAPADAGARAGLELWAVDVSAALRAADTGTLVSPAALLCRAPSRAGGLVAGRLHSGGRAVHDARALLAPLAAPPADATCWAAALLAAVRAAAENEPLPAGHPGHAARPSVRAPCVVWDESTCALLAIEHASAADSALAALGRAGARALSDDRLTEQLWVECWHAGLLRGVARPHARAGGGEGEGGAGAVAGAGAGGALDAAGDALLAHLEHAARAQPSREAFDVLGALRAAMGGDRQHALTVSRLHLMEVCLRHRATCAAVSAAAATNGANLSAVFIGSNARDLVREWAVAAADAQTALAHAALDAVAAAADGARGARAPARGARAEHTRGADAVGAALELAAVRANGLCAVLASLLSADMAAAAAGALEPAAAHAIASTLGALACAFAAMRAAAWLVAHGVVRAAPPPAAELDGGAADAVWLRFPLDEGPTLVAYAADHWPAADAPDDAAGGARARGDGGGLDGGVCPSPIGSASALLALAATSPEVAAERILYALHRAHHAVATVAGGGGGDSGAGARALGRLVRLVEATHPAHGVGVSRARAQGMRALAAADDGRWAEASALVLQPSGTPARALPFALAIARALCDRADAHDARDGGGGGDDGEVAAGVELADAARRLAAFLDLVAQADDDADNDAVLWDASSDGDAPAELSARLLELRRVHVRLCFASGELLGAYRSTSACADRASFELFYAQLAARASLHFLIHCPLEPRERAWADELLIADARERPPAASEAAIAVRFGLLLMHAEFAQAFAAYDQLGSAPPLRGLRHSAAIVLEHLSQVLPAGMAAELAPGTHLSARELLGADGSERGAGSRLAVATPLRVHGAPAGLARASPAPGGADSRVRGTPYALSRARASFVSALASPVPHELRTPTARERALGVGSELGAALGAVAGAYAGAGGGAAPGALDYAAGWKQQQRQPAALLASPALHAALALIPSPAGPPRAPAAVAHYAQTVAHDAAADVRAGGLAPSPLAGGPVHPFGVPLPRGALAAAAASGLSASAPGRPSCGHVGAAPFGGRLLQRCVASPAPASRAPSFAGSALPRAAQAQPTHLPTPKLALRMRSALPPSPQPWAAAASGTAAERGSPLFQPLPR